MPLEEAKLYLDAMYDIFAAVENSLKR
jgi:hypothetical protein